MSLFSPSVRAEVLVALELYRRELHSQGLRVSVDMAAFAALLTGGDLGGQSARQIANLADLLQAHPMSPFLLPVEEVARHLGGVNVRTVRRLIAEGALPAVKVGGRTMVRLADLEDYIAGLAPRPFTARIEHKDAS